MAVKKKTMQAVAALLDRYPSLMVCESSLRSAVEAICDCYQNQGKLVVLWQWWFSFRC